MVSSGTLDQPTTRQSSRYRRARTTRGRSLSRIGESGTAGSLDAVLLAQPAPGVPAGPRGGVLEVVLPVVRLRQQPRRLGPCRPARFLCVGSLQAHLGAVKMNYDILGNSLPHLHAHVIPRYADDPKPGWPFPFPDEQPPIPGDELAADVAALRALLDA